MAGDPTRCNTDPTMADSASRAFLRGEACNPATQRYLYAQRKMTARSNAMDMDDEYFRKTDGEIAPAGRKQRINLNMMVTNNPAFRDTYPKFREFLQNALDQLGLCENGVRTADTTVDGFADGDKDVICFNNGPYEMLRIVVCPDEVFLYQRHTYPLEKATLQNPVEDPTKKDSSQAGGFGEGFKVAVRQLLYEGANVVYHMFTDTEKVTWKFEAVPPSGSRQSFFSTAPKMMVVCESKRRVGKIAISEELDSNSKKWLAPYTLAVHVSQDGIGRHFLAGVVPHMTIFFDLEVTSVGTLQTTDGPAKLFHHNGDVFMHAKDMRLHPQVREFMTDDIDPSPVPGIYVLGLHVANGDFPEAIYLAGAKSMCKVSQRDRNIIEPRLFHGALRLLIKGILGNESEQRALLQASFQVLNLPSADRSVALASKYDLQERELEWLIPQDDAWKTVFGTCLLNRMHDMPSYTKFVDNASGRFLSWAIETCNSANPQTYVTVEVDEAVGVVDRAAHDEIKRRAFDMTPMADNDAPLAQAITFLQRIAFQDTPELADARRMIILKHSDTLHHQFDMEGAMGVTTVAANCNVVTVEAIQGMYRHLDGDVDQVRVHNMFRALYGIPEEDLSTETILNVLRGMLNVVDSDVAFAGDDDSASEAPSEGGGSEVSHQNLDMESDDDEATPGTETETETGEPTTEGTATGAYFAGETYDEVFREFKRCMEANDFVIVKKARNV